MSPSMIFEASRDVREDRGQKVIAANTLNLRWNLLAALKPKKRQSAVGIPAPARAENRRRQRRLLKNFVHGLQLQIVKDITEGEAVLFGQSNVQSVVGCCSL